jgi:hypothetical protein
VRDLAVDGGLKDRNLRLSPHAATRKAMGLARRLKGCGQGHFARRAQGECKARPAGGPWGGRLWGGIGTAWTAQIPVLLWESMHAASGIGEAEALALKKGEKLRGRGRRHRTVLITVGSFHGVWRRMGGPDRERRSDLGRWIGAARERRSPKRAVALAAGPVSRGIGQLTVEGMKATGKSRGSAIEWGRTGTGRGRQSTVLVGTDRSRGPRGTGLGLSSGGGWQGEGIGNTGGREVGRVVARSPCQSAVRGASRLAWGAVRPHPILLEFDSGP